MKNSIYLLIAVFVLFIAGIICFKYWMNTTMFIAEKCGHTETVVGNIIGFSAGTTDVSCVVQFPNGIWTVWGEGECIIGKPVIRNINDYTCH